ncbi:MAG: FxsA family protein [Hyphomicrobiaceae bacterium]|nr:FxsA family protein [Hyphomicrobiaceae bacterium]
MRIGLFFIFAAIPFLELAVLIKFGQAFGVLWTLLVIIGTALGGIYVLSTQSFQVMQRALDAVQRGKPPVAPVLEGAFVMMAGVLLITPGIMSDIVGLVLLIPQIRHRVAVFSLRQLLKSSSFRGVVFGEAASGAEGRQAADRAAAEAAEGQRTGKAARQTSRAPPAGDGPIIDGEFKRLDERTVDPQRPHGRRHQP